MHLNAEKNLKILFAEKVKTNKKLWQKGKNLKA